MDRFNFMKNFTEDIDHIVTGNPQATRKGMQSEYDDLLNLAKVLVKTELVTENENQQMLRRQLINRCLKKKSRYNKEVIMKNFLGKHRTALIACSLAMLVVLGSCCIFPHTMTAMAKSISNVLKLGSYVTVVSDTPAPDPSSINPLTPEQQSQLDKNGYVEFTDENGNRVIIGHQAEPAADKVNYSSLADAQQGVSYKLLVPTYLPAGYSFDNAECFKGSKDYITLNYQGPGKNIALMQRALNEDTQYELATDGKVEPVVINGREGVWDDSNLIWNIDDVNYILFAQGLSKEEIMNIAESVK